MSSTIFRGLFVTEPCPTDSMPRGCADKFAEIAIACEKLAGVAEDVKVIRNAVVGNGRTSSSLLFRVQTLEDMHSAENSARRKWGARFWQAVVAAALVVFGVWIKS